MNTRLKEMRKKKMAEQLAKISSKKKLYTSSCDKYEKILDEDKIRVTKLNEDKTSAPTSYINSSENEKKILKRQRKKIKKKKKKDTKVHYINNVKNDNGAILTDARHYSQLKECFVLLSDFNKHHEIHKTHKVSTSKSANTRGKKIKKINEKESKVQNINSLKNDNAAVLTDAKHYSQLKECFVLLSDFNKHHEIHKSHKASTSNSTKINSENNNEHSSMVNTKQQHIKKRKKVNYKVKRINNFINDNAVVHTEKKHCNQLKECFVLLSDFNKHHKIHTSHKVSTSKNANTRGKGIKKINEKESKVQSINSLINDNAVVHTNKRQRRVK